MGSPFYNKDKSNLKKPVKVQQLDKIVINAPKGKAFGSKAMKNHATYKLPKTAELPKQVKVDNIPSRPLKTPSERIVKKSVAEPINEKLIKHSTITPIEA